MYLRISDFNKEGITNTVVKNYNIIELNGNRYDAVTGALIGPQPITEQPVVQTRDTGSKKSSVKRGGTVDGIIAPAKKRTGHTRTIFTPLPVQPAPTLQSVAQKKTVTHTPKPLSPHKPEHSKTLMRHIVHKPKIVPTKPLKIQVPTDLTPYKPTAMTVKPKLSSELYRYQPCCACTTHSAQWSDRSFSPPTPHEFTGKQSKTN